MRRRTVREASYCGSRSPEDSIRRAPASLRIVEKRGSTSFLSHLTNCHGEISAVRASSSWVVNLRIYGPTAVTDDLGQQGSALGSSSFARAVGAEDAT